MVYAPVEYYGKMTNVVRFLGYLKERVGNVPLDNELT